MVSAEEEVPGHRCLRHSGAGTAAAAAQQLAATPGLGAGRRWLPRARRRAGRRWRRLGSQAGRHRGGGTGLWSGALAASRLGAREEDEDRGAAAAVAATLWARQAMSSDAAVSGRR